MGVTQSFPEEWLAIKQAYNRASKIERMRLEADYILRTWFSVLVWQPWKLLQAIKNFFMAARASKTGRGMDLLTAIRDWLDG